METKKIVVIPWDGIGPEVVEQGVKILKKIEEKFDIKFELDYKLMWACAIDETWEALPDDTLEAARESDAILFWAVGHPRFDNDPNAKVRPEQGLLKIRKELWLFANIRPVKIFDKLAYRSAIKENIVAWTDFIVFRELTGGIYFWEKVRKKDKAIDICEYSIYEIDRIVEMAFKQAMKREKKLISVDKANVLETSRLWRERVREIAKKYPEVEVENLYVDNAAMQMIIRPSEFDVVVTENMFWDILTDEASQISGSIWLLASASVWEQTGLFEPIHGSAPDIAWKNIANPIATILSVAMMLDYLDLKQEARVVEKAVEEFINSGYGTADIAENEEKTLWTKEVGDRIGDLV